MRKKVIFALAFLVYFVSVFGGFVWDDQRFLQYDPNLGKVEALASSWVVPYSSIVEGLYRPAVKFSFYLNGFITGYQPWGFHLGNILLYAWLCVLVYKVLSLFKIRGAFAWALIFTVLPIHTESVSNIVGRTDVMSLGFLLMAICFLYEKKWGYSAVMFLLAMLSKEVAVVGLVILGYLVIKEKFPIKEKRVALILYLIAAVIYCLLRLKVLGIDNYAKGLVGIVENPLHFVSTTVRVINAFSIMTIGLAKTFVPWHLLYDYSYNQIPLIYSWWNPQVLLGVLIAVASVASLFTPLRKNKTWILGMMFVWGPLMITGNFLFPSAGIFAERWYFWPSLGIMMLLSNVSIKMWPKWLVITVLLLYTGRTVVRNIDWLSMDSLLFHDGKILKNNVKAKWAEAGAYFVRKDWKKVEETLTAAERIYDRDSRVYLGWANYYKEIGKMEQAKKNYQKCLDLEPTSVVCKKELDSIK